MTTRSSTRQKLVVVGQGYVGLPLAYAAVSAGLEVVGLDLNEQRVSALNAGQSVIDDLGDAEIAEMLARGYRASTSSSEFRDANVIVICVPTPLGAGNEPNLGAVRTATSSIARELSAGTLVILESTTYPGTTVEEVVPVLLESGLELGTEFFVAYSPERIDPGNKRYGITNTPKVVGADDPESLDRATAFYSNFIDEVVQVSGTAEAELTKLLENTYRHINIGLVNELAVVCHELGIDVWEVIRAASTKPFGFQPFYPGPGVGGHCIPIDPNYLSHRVRQALGRPFRFVELAQDINSSMPGYVVSRAQDLLNQQKKALNGSNVLLVGVTYKSGISDTRESPASELFHLLRQKGAVTTFYDPLVSTWQMETGETRLRVDDLELATRRSDLTILLQGHEGLDLAALVRDSSLLLDTRGLCSGERVVSL
ncbi:nucleotide sugar dehydrogenase [Leucobacter massiliensis]|uniref:UDP-N-acetyl-D-glucosamine dehydrogenase n=1 Tax=Leucobacter massiliensis TaxID=1686285 RepID=A0A2S9QN41_9MICO|nr:nucleotide sugar dehydrogenase [Leucobacter massiliensis]PRI11016.1 UDP-N-acetyl-D-glucosamine dehydrogenase [Leucobacter massiliensis]